MTNDNQVNNKFEHINYIPTNFKSELLCLLRA